MLLLLALAASAASASAGIGGQALDAALSPLGSLTLGLNGDPWLVSGATAMRQKAQWYVSDCPASGVRDTGIECEPFTAGASSTESGSDAVGAYTQSSITWSAKGDATAT